MTMVAVVEKPLQLRYLRTSDIESDIVSCGVGGVPLGCWVSCTGSWINVCINLGQVQALWSSLLGSFEELLLSD